MVVDSTVHRSPSPIVDDLDFLQAAEVVIPKTSTYSKKTCISVAEKVQTPVLRCKKIEESTLSSVQLDYSSKRLLRKEIDSEYSLKNQTTAATPSTYSQTRKKQNGQKHSDLSFHKHTSKRVMTPQRSRGTGLNTSFS